MTRQEHLFIEIVYDLSYLAGMDELHMIIEDSRVLCEIIKDWSQEFHKKYPMPEEIVDFSEIYGVDYITAIDNFYVEKRNEYVRDYYNIVDNNVLNIMFKNKT